MKAIMVIFQGKKYLIEQFSVEGMDPSDAMISDIYVTDLLGNEVIDDTVIESCIDFLERSGRVEEEALENAIMAADALYDSWKENGF